MTRPAESLRSSAAALPPALAGWFAGQGWVPHPHQMELLAADDDTLLIAPFFKAALEDARRVPNRRRPP